VGLSSTEISQTCIPVVLSGGGRAFHVPCEKTMSLDHRHSCGAIIATDYCDFLLMLVREMDVQGHFVLHKISDPLITGSCC
jgi:hypothetical protein